MKHLTLLLFVIANCIPVQAQKDAKKIIGQWNYSFSRTTTAIDVHTFKQADTGFKDSPQISFNADQTVVIVTKDKPNQTFRYKVKGNRLKFIDAPESGLFGPFGNTFTLRFLKGSDAITLELVKDEGVSIFLVSVPLGDAGEK